MKRRDFLGLAAAGAVVGGCASAAGRTDGGRILFGACRGIGDTATMKRVGYDFFESGVGAMLIPDRDEEAWKRQREAIRAAALPLRSCNGFLPGTFRLTGPKAAFDAPLAYAEKACRRADEVGVKTIVFGSGGARNVPGDFCGKNRPPVQEGRDQFRDFCRALAARIADCKVTVVIEPLCPNESNIVNYVWQGLQIVEEVGSPRIQQLADLFHMMAGLEDAASIVKAGSRLRHCHIAERKTRTAPGLKGDGSEFVPYFEALREIGYAGGVSCECGWGERKDFEKNLVTALSVMKRLAGQV